MADRIVLMNRGEIQQVGSPSEIYVTPANTFVARFVGSPPMNLIEGRDRIRAGGPGLPSARSALSHRRRRACAQRWPGDARHPAGAHRDRRCGSSRSRAGEGRPRRARRRRLQRLPDRRRRRVADRQRRRRDPDPRGRRDLTSVCRSSTSSSSTPTATASITRKAPDERPCGRRQPPSLSSAHTGRSRCRRPCRCPIPGRRPAIRLSISPDRRRLLDADGRPFLVQGDAAWSLIANLDLRGCGPLSRRPPRQGLQHAHRQPDRASLLARSAARPRRPRAVLDAGRTWQRRTTPISTRRSACSTPARSAASPCCWRPATSATGTTAATACRSASTAGTTRSSRTGPDGCRVYGEYLGRRFGRFANIIWMIGGDWHPEEARTGLDAIADGIRSTGVKNLFTAHPHPEFSPIESFAGSSWLDVNVTYTYGIVHRSLIADWQRDPPWPFFLIELTYEGEHNASHQQIRRQAYWSVLCGGNGHCMGNYPIWLFWDGWQDALDLPGSVAMARWGGFFRALPWSELVPDLELRLCHGRPRRGARPRPRHRGADRRRPPRRRLSAGAPAGRSASRRSRRPARRGRVVRAGERPAPFGRHARGRGRGDAGAALRGGRRAGADVGRVSG